MLKYYREWKRRRVIRRLRANLAFFGVDVSDQTDEQLEAAVVSAGQQIGAVGVTVVEAYSAMASLANLSRQQP